MIPKIPEVQTVEVGNSRYYMVGGKPEKFPSVTTILGDVLAKPALIGWTKRIALSEVREELHLSYQHDGFNFSNRFEFEQWADAIIERANTRPDKIKNRASEIGRGVHKAIEQVTANLPYEKTKENEVGVTAFKRFLAEDGIKIIGSEITLYSPSMRYAGCMDALGADKDGNLLVIDYKTSKGVYLEMGFQVGGYALAYEELTGNKITGGIIIKIPKVETQGQEIRPEPYYIKDMRMAKDGFILCKNLYDIKKQDDFFLPCKNGDNKLH